MMFDRERYMASMECVKTGAACCAKTWRAIKRGALTDKRGFPCVDCGRTATINEHRDYEKWWEIEPVCRGCNVKRGHASPFKHLAVNWRAKTMRFSTGHEPYINQFANSLFHLNDE